MANFRFIHAGDIHLDSPLGQLRSLDQSAADAVAMASRVSFQKIIDLAVEREVAALIVAGDLFDGPVRDASGALWADSQLKKLVRAGIEVILIRGNHDAISGAGKASRWSHGIVELGSTAPQTHLIDRVGLAVHGQSFGARAVTQDLAANYPRMLNGYFNVGLLHTSLAGSSAHEPYAPTTLSVLESLGYQYWALGHIHKRSEISLSNHCWIGYCGNAQGRHIRESGPKGCYLGHVQDGKLWNVEFVSTDTVRWYEVCVDVSTASRLNDLDDQVFSAIGELATQANSRHLAVRVTLTGHSHLHATLSDPFVVERLTTTLSDRVHELGNVWLESVKIATEMPEARSSSADIDLPLQCLRDVVDDIRLAAGQQTQLHKSLEELSRKVRGELETVGWTLWEENHRQDELERLLEQAADLLRSRIHNGAGT